MGSRTEPDSGRTSDLPSDEVEGKMRVLTSDDEEYSTLLDQDITKIQSTAPPENDYIHPIASQLEAGHSVQNLQATHKPAVKKLPPELLSLIFMHCREGRETALILPRSGWFPWVLGQVSSQWRQILLSTELWSDIQVRSRPSLEEQEDLPSLVDRVITQAQGPVSLKVPLLEIDVFRKVITPYSGRFRSLQLTLSLDFLGIFLNLPLNFTSLKSLQITVAKTPLLHPVMTHQTDALQNAPQLDRFSLFYTYLIKHLCPTYALSGLWLPWPQLTFFECRGAHSIADLHDVLSRCIALRECSVVVRASLEGETATYTHRPIVLPCLRIFYFTPFSDGVDWATFLRPFMLPSLEGLRCESQAQEASEALVARSGCHLKDKGNLPLLTHSGLTISTNNLWTVPSHITLRL